MKLDQAKTFKIFYDDQPDDVVDRMSLILKNFDIEINQIIEGDSYLEYQISKKILQQKYLFNTTDDGYYLSKKYEHQEGFIEWTADDVALVYGLFKDTVLNYELPTNLIPLDGTECIKEDSEPIGKTEDGWIVCKPEPSPWLIERPIRCDNEYLSISENGKKNRPWKVEEIKEIEKLFNKK